MTLDDVVARHIHQGSFLFAFDKASPQGNDDEIGKSGWREILSQIKVWKTKEYWMYF